MTIVGTRFEIINLNLIIRKLDGYCSHLLVHTGQNDHSDLSYRCFKDLNLREPDYYLGVRANTEGEQIGRILTEAEKIIIREKPDRMLILGSANGGLVSIIAKRMGIATFHIEAGNRCFNAYITEEVNRIIIDCCSTVLLPYTHRSKENLLKEGFNNERIHVIGNPIYEVMTHYSKEIDESKILDLHGVKPQKYFLVTIQSEENVDDEYRLKSTFTGLDRINTEYNFPIICSLPTRTRDKIKQCNLIITNKDIHLSESFSFFDFIHLEKNATCVITDSGSIQDECCILGTPNITIRDVTERPETIECGSTMLASTSPKIMLKSVEIALREKHHWIPPPEYLDNNVSSKVVKIILGYLNDQQGTRQKTTQGIA